MVRKLSKTLTIEKENLEKDLANLAAQYDVVKNQSRQTVDEQYRFKFEEKAKDILQQMEQVEQKLEQLEDSENNSNHRALDIQANLLEIDFCEAMKVVDKITSRFDKEGGAALFLIENSYSMAGELCISRIREQLKRKTASFRHLKLEISFSNRPDEFCLLERLAGYLNLQVEALEDIEKYTKLIIKHICQSLQNGSVIFIEINKWNYLQYQERILPWFLNNFWYHLIEESRTIAQQNNLRRVKFVAVIDSESDLNEECKSLPCYCTTDNFDKTKILKLPLDKWQEKDIQEWLENYSCLPTYQIDMMAKQIYSKTQGGFPFMVCEALKKELL